uniref:Uncharacterized protein n=1 Tax=Candidatus Methanogaster sp. ANME-2c ERB4 TaxID=2759911 RepID=A0A7G9YRB8_9EURY|nr:hypothetical protein HGEBJNHG_00025 [Methanosarcinales archaeon ANME-2c ERB4]
MYFALRRYISRHHLRKAYLGCRAQYFFVFLDIAPQFIAFEWCDPKGLYEIFIHLCRMFSHIFQQLTYSVSVVACDPLDTPYTILLY